MPSRGESDLTIDLNTSVGPGGVTVLGQALPNPDLEASELVAFEIGWRATFGEALSFDATAYRGRNVIERFFALAKQWRGIATRFDKLAITYRAGVTLCAILTWVRLLGDTT